jgi:hypothetical protein
MTEDIATRVAAGVGLLDEQEPGWLNKIDLTQFDIASTHRCVLGQVYGSFHEGVSNLGLCGDDEQGCRELEYGFDVSDSRMNEAKWEYADLQKEWVRVIEALRQKAEVKESVQV